MSQTPNNRVSLRDHFDARFDALERRLDKIADDHEDRIRSLEKQAPLRTVAEAVTGVVATAAAAFSFLRD